ncbi:MAG: plasmid partitioning protein RepB, partial [Rhodobacterales bacterium]
TNGQTVPILVRRHPTEADRYLLVYGRRRLEAIRLSDKVDKVRALVANIDDDAALRAQISENMARRDLSFIEKALFAKELVESGFGNQSQVAEVLTVTKSSISMAISIAETIGTDLARAIGPAHGIGRPKWEALAKAIEETGISRDRLIDLAAKVHDDAAVSLLTQDNSPDTSEVSAQAFDAVTRLVAKAAAQTSAPSPARRSSRSRPLLVSGQRGGTVRRSDKGVSLDLDTGPFADWIDSQAEDLVAELHARWKKRAED